MIRNQMPFPVFFRILLFIILILFPLSATAQRYSNISLGSSIVAGDTNSIWISPSGEFAFGFQQIVPGGGYLLAIWFDKIPEKTIVWSANRDNPAEEGSKIQLFADGRLKLDDPRGQEIWAANFVRSANPDNPAEEGSKIQLFADGRLELDDTRSQEIWAANFVRSGIVAYGAMLDSGNFVLAENTSAVVWQSFNEPTDTLLPAQILSRDISLISSFSETKNSKGRFKLTLTGDGKLILQSSNFPMDSIIYKYWSAEISGIGYQLIFNQSGYIFLTAENGTILNFLSSNGASTSQFYQRAILEYDGVLRHYVYPKSANSTGGRAMEWSVLVPPLPSNICTAFNDPYGSGACGFNSFCSVGNDGRPICGCPAGYTPVDSNARMSGCKPNFFPHNCDPQSQETELFSFSDMPNTDWVGADYAGFRSVAEDWCREACLDDCFCAAVVYENRNCWKMRYPLSNGRIDGSFRGKSLVKMRINNVTTQPSSNFPILNKSNKFTLINATLSILLFSSIFLLFLASASLIAFYCPSEL